MDETETDFDDFRVIYKTFKFWNLTTFTVSQNLYTFLFTYYYYLKTRFKKHITICNFEKTRNYVLHIIVISVFSLFIFDTITFPEIVQIYRDWIYIGLNEV